MDQNEGAQPRRFLGSYTAPTPDFYGRSICVPLIRADNFELNPQLITLVQQNCQFHRLPQEEPTEFLADLLWISDTIRTDGVDHDVYRLLLFPFAVKGQANRWLDTQPKSSLKTWNKLMDKFLNQYFLPKKLTQLRLDIQGFRH
ncbi:hypothetical protein AHAS_Ahas15G0161700 [Arachis hypogaea]